MADKGRILAGATDLALVETKAKVSQAAVPEADEEMPGLEEMTEEEARSFWNR